MFGRDELTRIWDDSAKSLFELVRGSLMQSPGYEGRIRSGFEMLMKEEPNLTVGELLHGPLKLQRYRGFGEGSLDILTDKFREFDIHWYMRRPDDGRLQLTTRAVEALERIATEHERTMEPKERLLERLKAYGEEKRRMPYATAGEMKPEDFQKETRAEIEEIWRAVQAIRELIEQKDN